MFLKIFSFSLSILFPIMLLAHGNHGNGIMAGFTHPIFGLDHFVAILGAGFLAYLINSTKWYLQLISFVLLMIIGGLLGINNDATFLIEKIIAFSVFVIGLIIALNFKLNLVSSILILGIFGFFHGYAHGAEMSESNTALKYISGYALGTLLVGTFGMFICKIINLKQTNEKYLRIIGGIICGIGIMMLIA